MKNLARGSSLFLATMFVLGAHLAHAAATSSDVHILPDGTFHATNVVVMQKAGDSDLSCRLNWDWGNKFMRITVLAHDNTAITKNHGEKSVSADIMEGDVLNIDGSIYAADNGLSIDALAIRDLTLNVETKTLSGTVQSINIANSSFVLANKTFGLTTVTATSTTFQKGQRAISLSDLVIGDKITSVTGTYDYQSKILTALSVQVYQTGSIFVSHNFQGTLKNISGGALPVILTVTVDGTDYTVYVATGGTILSNNKSPTTLTRFVVGDTVRFFGAIRQSNLSEVDATVLRDLNF